MGEDMSGRFKKAREEIKRLLELTKGRKVRRVPHFTKEAKELIKQLKDKLEDAGLKDGDINDIIKILKKSELKLLLPKDAKLGDIFSGREPGIPDFIMFVKLHKDIYEIKVVSGKGPGKYKIEVKKVEEEDLKGKETEKEMFDRISKAPDDKLYYLIRAIKISTKHGRKRVYEFTTYGKEIETNSTEAKSVIPKRREVAQIQQESQAEQGGGGKKKAELPANKQRDETKKPGKGSGQEPKGKKTTPPVSSKEGIEEPEGKEQQPGAAKTEKITDTDITLLLFQISTLRWPTRRNIEKEIRKLARANGVEEKEVIEKLQGYLNLDFNLKVDGILGPETYSAIMRAIRGQREEARKEVPLVLHELMYYILGQRDKGKNVNLIQAFLNIYLNRYRGYDHTNVALCYVISMYEGRVSLKGFKYNDFGEYVANGEYSDAVNLFQQWYKENYEKIKKEIKGKDVPIIGELPDGSHFKVDGKAGKKTIAALAYALYTGAEERTGTPPAGRKKEQKTPGGKGSGAAARRNETPEGRVEKEDQRMVEDILRNYRLDGKRVSIVAVKESSGKRYIPMGIGRHTADVPSQPTDGVSIPTTYKDRRAIKVMSAKDLLMQMAKNLRGLGMDNKGIKSMLEKWVGSIKVNDNNLALEIKVNGIKEEEKNGKTSMTLTLGPIERNIDKYLLFYAVLGENALGTSQREKLAGLVQEKKEVAKKEK